MLMRRIKIPIKRSLTNAPDDQKFWLTSGEPLANLADLEKSLRQMDQAGYDYHVTGAKNDFASWTRSALNDPELADKLLTAVNPAAAATVVGDWLKRRYQI